MLQLLQIPQPLEGRRVYDFALLGGQVNKMVNRIRDPSDLVLGHSNRRTLASAELVGRRTISAEIEETDDELTISFDNGRLQLDLREREQGPIEIAILHFDTGEEIVF